MSEPKPPDASQSLSELPVDELIRYGCSLGLTLAADTPHGEALRLVRRRRELLLELDRDAMLDAVRWLRLPVTRSVGKEGLAQLISQQHPTRYDGLSDRGLQVLARLNGVDPLSGESRGELERRLRRAGGWAARIRGLRRRAIGSVVARIVRSASDPKNQDADYKYLPDEEARSIQADIEQTGLVGGVARRLRGVADDYVQEKLDEIERRIDRKLDEIDNRLGEWRDRELSNRLKILKITLLFSIVVAILSLLYDRFRP